MFKGKHITIGFGGALAVLVGVGWVWWRGASNVDVAAGAFIGLAVIGWIFSVVRRDRAGHTHTEQTLLESAARYRAVSELTSDYTYAFRIESDGSVVVEWIGGAFTRITGYTPEEVETRGGGLTLLHPDDVPIALLRLQALVSGQPDTSEFRILTKSGEVRWVRENARPVWDEAQGKMRVFGAAQDVSERKRAEERAHQHQAELAHVLRVSTIGEMAATLAHEINQPLSAIVSYAKGCARRLKAGAGDPRELQETMEHIAAQALRADQIIRRLRDFVRNERPRRERVQIDQLVRDVRRLVDPEAREHGVTIHLTLPPGLPPVEVHRVQIEQVVLNLVRNGFEALEGSDPAQRVLSIETSMADAAIEVAVRDDGKGLSAAETERIFAPFFTTKPNGLGMGLSISRSIIEAHGGHLWATPNDEHGTTFRFTVPVKGGGTDGTT